MKAILLATLFLLPQQKPPPQDVTKGDWVVVYTFRSFNNNVLEPECRINMLVKADSEGEAALKTSKFLTDKLTIAGADNLVFLEAQRKK